MTIHEVAGWVVYLLFAAGPPALFLAWALIAWRRDRKARRHSVRVEMVDFDDGERGCRFIVGDDHVVAEWRGDGIASDTIFVEEPALTYFVTTTPLDRCVRMALEMAHWEITSAMLAGPGDGELLAFCERYPRDEYEDDDEDE